MKRFDVGHDVYILIKTIQEFDSLENSHLSEWKGEGLYKTYIHYRFDTYQYDKISPRDHYKILTEIEEEIKKLQELDQIIRYL